MATGRKKWLERQIALYKKRLSEETDPKQQDLLIEELRNLHISVIREALK